MRTKKHRTSLERLQQVCSGPVFQHLARHDAHFFDRIRIIDGDLSKPQLGIGDASVRLELIQHTDIIIHAAADVRFNEPLTDLILCNLIGTRDLLDLAKQMANLQVFVYMSTAFSNTKNRSTETIDEAFYAPPMDADILIDYVARHASDTDRQLLNIISPNLIAPWPNNYTFSKALSESIVRRYERHFPIAVIRPTISKFILFDVLCKCSVAWWRCSADLCACVCALRMHISIASAANCAAARCSAAVCCADGI